MTVHELSQLYHLQKEIQQLSDQLYRVQHQPHSPEVEAQAADTLARIHQRQDQYTIERNRLEQWIITVDDSLTRRVLTERFINCKTWTQVAQSIGGGNTKSSVKMICYRYLKNH